MAGVGGLCRDMATRTTRSAKGSNRLKPLASASADEEREREKGKRTGPIGPRIGWWYSRVVQKLTNGPLGKPAGLVHK